MTIRDLFDRLDWTRFRVTGGKVRDDAGRCPLSAAFNPGEIAGNLGMCWLAQDAGMDAEAAATVLRAADNLIVTHAEIDGYADPEHRTRARFDRVVRALMLRRIRHPSIPLPSTI